MELSYAIFKINVFKKCKKGGKKSFLVLKLFFMFFTDMSFLVLDKLF